MNIDEKKNLRTYLLVWIALLVLLALTAASAYVKLGSFNIVVSMCISIAKTALVMGLFMELRREHGTTIVFAIAGFFWLILLIAPTLSDVVTR
ncbi:MAG TPA: cytochrome C oxidase subunit IV family protein [Rudaea sp.]|jgi:cytochrome c oxidase subunit 4|nr:cytochrome C oxidase subunit IV family protein [Rudaea sp.]